MHNREKGENFPQLIEKSLFRECIFSQTKVSKRFSGMSDPNHGKTCFTEAALPDTFCSSSPERELIEYQFYSDRATLANS